jgi:hypothetical protein
MSIAAPSQAQVAIIIAATPANSAPAIGIGNPRPDASSVLFRLSRNQDGAKRVCDYYHSIAIPSEPVKAVSRHRRRTYFFIFLRAAYWRRHALLL